MILKPFFFILIFITFALIFLWQGIYLPKSSFVENKIFSIEKGQGLSEIAKNLEREGLIKNRFFFDIYLILKGKQKNLQAGKYVLNSSMSIPEIAEKIISGKTLKIKVTIPEGMSSREISEILLEKGVTKEDLNSFKIKDFKDEFEFLKDAPENANLEGFLFPETYFFDFDMKGKEVVRIFLKTFEKKVWPSLRVIENKTIYEIIIMASLVEKEVFNTPECENCKNLVSGILWKRLENGIPLQVDATITYITGKKTTQISIEETKIDNPYNTYKYLGLPPGPICNPGLESILAASYPKESQYWYYLSTPEGKTIFSQTLREHNLAKEKYLK